MISVSLDDGKEEWLKELDRLEMKWSQAIALGEIELIEAKYGFPRVPYIMIVDGNRKLMKGVLGFEEGNGDKVSRYLSIFNKETQE